MSDVSQYIYRLRPTRLEMLTSGPTERERQVVSDHFNYLKNLCEQGVVLLAGRTLNNDEKTFGIAILNGVSEQQAQAIVQDDPAVKNGVMTAELFPFRVGMISEQRLK